MKSLSIACLNISLISGIFCLAGVCGLVSGVLMVVFGVMAFVAWLLTEY